MLLAPPAAAVSYIFYCQSIADVVAVAAAAGSALTHLVSAIKLT